MHSGGGAEFNYFIACCMKIDFYFYSDVPSKLFYEFSFFQTLFAPGRFKLYNIEQMLSIGLYFFALKFWFSNKPFQIWPEKKKSAVIF